MQQNDRCGCGRPIDRLNQTSMRKIQALGLRELVHHIQQRRNQTAPDSHGTIWGCDDGAWLDSTILGYAAILERDEDAFVSTPQRTDTKSSSTCVPEQQLLPFPPPEQEEQGNGRTEIT